MRTLSNLSMAAALLVGVVASTAGNAAELKTGEAVYLDRYEGAWSGTGHVRLGPGGPTMSVSCSFAGSAEGARLDLQGTCGGMLMRTQVHARLQYDARVGSYSGSWATGSSSAGLTGKRLGDHLSLAVKEPSEPDRRLTLAVQKETLRVAMTRTDDEAQVLAVSLRRTSRVASAQSLKP